MNEVQKENQLEDFHCLPSPCLINNQSYIDNSATKLFFQRDTISLPDQRPTGGKCNIITSRLHLTSDRAAPGDHLPQDQSHGVNVGLLEGLDVFQIDSGLQDLGGHIPGGAHLGKQSGGEAPNKLNALLKPLR